MKNGLIINDYGTKFYYLNDLFHREDGPAFEYPDGYKSYWINGKRHREEGPAIEMANGDKFYYLNDQEYSEENYWEEIKKRKSLNFILSNIKKEKC
jgi:hypothetical protein